MAREIIAGNGNIKKDGRHPTNSVNSNYKVVDGGNFISDITIKYGDTRYNAEGVRGIKILGGPLGLVVSLMSHDASAGQAVDVVNRWRKGINLGYNIPVSGDKVGGKFMDLVSDPINKKKFGVDSESVQELQKILKNKKGKLKRVTQSDKNPYTGEEILFVSSSNKTVVPKVNGDGKTVLRFDRGRIDTKIDSLISLAKQYDIDVKADQIKADLNNHVEVVANSVDIPSYEVNVVGNRAAFTPQGKGSVNR